MEIITATHHEEVDGLTVGQVLARMSELGIPLKATFSTHTGYDGPQPALMWHDTQPLQPHAPEPTPG
jgi:hypothetical protein